MAPSSVEIDEYDRHPSHLRSRSGSYVDHIEEKTRWDRRSREREMKRYHDSRYGTASFSRSSNQPTPDRLGVPVFETTGRTRSSSDASRRPREPERRYNTQEVRPSTVPVDRYDLTSEPILPSQSTVVYERKMQHQKKPSIKVEIHQDNPPLSVSGTFAPKRSPSASPRSRTAQPQLQYQYATIQNKLYQISSTCAPYIDVEAAEPQDLTFEKIVEQTKAFSFDLRVWAHLANIEGMARVDSRKREVVDAASRSLDRLLDQITTLNDACFRAKPRDLKFKVLPEVEDDSLFEDGDDDSLHSIELQIQNLKRLSRTLQEATPDAKSEVMAIAGLVAETVKYFGSQEALSR
ncbi:hypothetical protein J4E82_000978 [Alternaria postmessia]|uniref:uncharacterized protein n=1 Tax=Alternaria postmessia TaxID=1187938 RepID=UPI002224D0E6|nr:uncharacterized protein J4E82_000978 [Alternaria postmessia]KAI5380401.1 hypothetical protein J4E82_000978 [Alternaria postmessia]